MKTISLESRRSISSKPSPRTRLSPRCIQDSDSQLLRAKVTELEKLLDWERKRGQQLTLQLVEKDHQIDHLAELHREEIERLKLEERHRRTVSELPAGEHVAREMDTVTQLHGLVQSNIAKLQENAVALVEEQRKGVSRHMELRMHARLREKEGKMRQLEEENQIALEKEETARKRYEECKESWLRSEELKRKYLQQSKDLEEIRIEQEGVVQALQKQVAGLKAECLRLADLVQALESTENCAKRSFSPPIRAKTQPEVHSRTEIVIGKLQKMLENERKNAKAAKAALAGELKAKTELESFLRDCLTDLRLVIGKYQRNAGLSEAERSEVISALMSQAQVLRLLYDRTFPPKGANDFFKGPFVRGTGQGLNASLPLHSGLEEL